MDKLLLLIGIVLVLCVGSSKISNRFGIPILFIFIILGMLFGSDGLFKIEFDNFKLTSDICNVGLIFIMFYGGFGTNWKTAKPVAVQSILLSTFGVVFTALFTGLFCHFFLKIPIFESLLLGSVIGSTDAATVFSILRSKKLNLKNSLAPLLEVESGSNDPTAFTLTTIFIYILTNKLSFVPYLIFAQIIYGLITGFLIAYLTLFILKNIHFDNEGLLAIFIVGMMLLSYSIPSIFKGNGYLSVYITGIILGNSKIHKKIELVHFFDATTWFMQIVIFFILGLLSFPTKLPGVFLSASATLLFMTFIARPLSVFLLLTPFKIPFKQQLIISWAGFRGVAAIVFSIYAMSMTSSLSYDIYHIVFLIALISVVAQGGLLPFLAKKLKIIDNDNSVMKTFTDYQDKTDIKLYKVIISSNHPWCNQEINQIELPSDSLIVMIKRGEASIIPRGNITLTENDIVIMSSLKYPEVSEVRLSEYKVMKGSSMIGKQLKNIRLPSNTLVVLIMRDDESIIPKGDTIIKRNDILVVNEGWYQEF